MPISPNTLTIQEMLDEIEAYLLADLSGEALWNIQEAHEAGYWSSPHVLLGPQDAYCFSLKMPPKKEKQGGRKRKAATQGGRQRETLKDTASALSELAAKSAEFTILSAQMEEMQKKLDAMTARIQVMEEKEAAQVASQEEMAQAFSKLPTEAYNKLCHDIATIILSKEDNPWQIMTTTIQTELKSAINSQFAESLTEDQFKDAVINALTHVLNRKINRLLKERWDDFVSSDQMADSISAEVSKIPPTQLDILRIQSAVSTYAKPRIDEAVQEIKAAKTSTSASSTSPPTPEKATTEQSKPRARQKQRAISVEPDDDAKETERARRERMAFNADLEMVLQYVKETTQDAATRNRDSICIVPKFGNMRWLNRKDIISMVPTARQHMEYQQQKAAQAQPPPPPQPHYQPQPYYTPAPPQYYLPQPVSAPPPPPASSFYAGPPPPRPG